MNNIIEINDVLFNKKVLTYLGYVLVIFYSKWCGPCKLFFNILIEIYNNYKNVLKFFKINVNKSNLIIKKYNIYSVPTIILFNKGILISYKIGLLNKKELVKFLDLHLITN